MDGEEPRSFTKLVKFAWLEGELHLNSCVFLAEKAQAG
jgi:hypothetical protein